MNGFSYLVLGAGEVGPAIALWLLRQRDTCRVIIADAKLPAALRAWQKTASAKDIRDHRCTITHLDVSAADEREIRGLFASVDCVISAIPASYSPHLAQIALDADTNFCDLGGVTTISQRMRRDLTGAAKRVGKSIVHDCGFAPGLSNQMTQVLFHLTGGFQRIITYVGGLPQRPQESAHYWQRTFSAKGLVEILNHSLMLYSGKVTWGHPCTGGTTLEIPSLAACHTQFGTTVKTRVTAGAGVAPEVMEKLGVKDCWEETIRWDWGSFLNYVERIPKEILVETLEKVLPHTSPEFPDIAVMRVVASANGWNVAYDLFAKYSPTLDMSAMAQVTGFSAAAVARRVAQGGIPPGVLAPEEIDWKINAALIEDLSVDFDIRLGE